MSPALLFAVPTAIWGSTWLAIKYQLGEVPPQASVAYRFALAALILAALCAARGQSLRFPLRTHAWIAAQGATVFGLSYVAVYLAEAHIASGLVAVLFSTIVFMTPIGVRLAFGTPIASATMIGAALGVAGVALLSLPELRSAGEAGDAALGIGYALAAPVISSIGNLVTMRLQRDHVPVFAGTAWGMTYGALTAALAATLIGTTWTFDFSLPYVASLGYLSVFGSIIAFLAYFELLKEVGAARASFLGVATPVIAMLLSTLFEDYRWSAAAIAGVALAVAGNVIALRPRRKPGATGERASPR